MCGTQKFFLFALLLMAYCAFSTSARAFPPSGATGPGLPVIIDSCPSGQFLVGVDARSGAWMDQISITCAKFDPASGSTAGTRYHGPARGGIGGGPSSKECNADHLITGVGITMRDEGDNVRMLIFNCVKPNSNPIIRHNLDVGNNSPFFPSLIQTCPTGQAAIGIETVFNNFINAVGVDCGQIPGAVAQKTEPPQPCPGVRADEVPAEWSEMLKAHNERRKLHCVKPLTWSNEMAEQAQAFADECKIGQHAGSSDGENLADAWRIDSNGQPVLPALSDREAFETTWYCEVANYNFQDPKIKGGFTTNCREVNGHFTQVVWKDSCQLGCGRAKCSMGKDAEGNPIMGTHWVCRYRPPGNVNADDPAVLRKQVFAPGSPECR